MAKPPRSTECVRLPPALFRATKRDGCSLLDITVAALGGEEVYLQACAFLAVGGEEDLPRGGPEGADSEAADCRAAASEVVDSEAPEGDLDCSNGDADMGAARVAGGLGAP